MTTSQLTDLVNQRETCREALTSSIKNLRPLGNVGRKPKDITVINITDALRRHTTIADAAAFLGVSRGFIYERVKNPKEYLAEVRK